ncbi:hypothetical protein [Streptomyces sp. NPDC001404]|uniref:hypothetical protein n=1 Tax=Streptomyces sp. NPDC001404 TaxID=3364571 RepID=UPI0036C76AF6
MSRHISNDLKKRARELAARESIPYSAALARLRTSHAAAPATDRPKRFLVPDYLYVDFPAPDLRSARPCEGCTGTGLDGQGRTFAMESDGGRPPLLVEAVCSSCSGCGRAEHDEERGCGHPHTDPDMDDGWDDEDDEDAPGLGCYSCSGREFNYLQGVLEDDDGEPAEVIYLRAPCGCTADRMRVISGEPVEVTA